MKKYNYIHIIHFLFLSSFIATVKALKTLSERFLYHNETHFLKYLCLLNNYSNMKEEKKFSTIIFSFANTFSIQVLQLFFYSKINIPSIFIKLSKRTILDLTSGGELFRVYDLRSEFVTSALLNASSNHREGTPETKRDR